tara:strand:+ start:4317 stop:5057 length:741 start_codon:yes stop_codon:yes gene_type:complete
MEKPEKTVQLASGSAVHKTIQDVLSGEVPFDGREGYVEHCLTQILIHREDWRDQVSKYLPGALRALSKVPDWVWVNDWKVEERLEVEIAEGVTLKFVPDLYAITKEVTKHPVTDEDIVVYWLDIYDFKTGKKDPLEYYLNSPQLSYYAVALKKLFPYAHPRICYVGLPTQGSSGAEVSPWVLTDIQLQEAEEELVSGIREVGEGDRWANRSTLCGWCDFNRVCTTKFMGGNWKDVLMSEYTKRVRV